MTRAQEKQHVDPEDLVLSLTKLRDFLMEREVKELSIPVFDPNRGRLHPRELYALIHKIFSDTNIEVSLHKKKLLEHRLRVGRMCCLLCVLYCVVM